MGAAQEARRTGLDLTAASPMVAGTRPARCSRPQSTDQPDQAQDSPPLAPAAKPRSVRIIAGRQCSLNASAADIEANSAATRAAEWGPVLRYQTGMLLIAPRM